MNFSLAEIAKISGAVINGAPETTIRGVSSLTAAQSGDISFLSNKRYVRYLKTTKASAVILSSEYKDLCPVDSLVCDDPYLAIAKVLRAMHSEKECVPGIHSSAVISDKSSIDKSVSISAHVFIDEGCNIGAGVQIGPGCSIGRGVVIGAGSKLSANVTINDAVEIGKNALLHPGVVIGADGFGIVKDQGAWIKIPQIGSVQIGNNVEIGANSTVDRGAIADTVIEDGVKLDNQVQIGHGVRLGEHTAIAGCVGVAGSAVIGKRCMIGGLSAISGHIEIADDVIITGMSGVSNSIKIAGVYSSGIPVTENKKWRRNIARFRNLDDITKRLLQLEQEMGAENNSD